MTKRPVFRLLDISGLSIHEEIDPARVDELVEEIRSTGVVLEPIWVAEDHHVILNGHHRFTALRKLGAVRVPAWVVPYDDPRVRLERWKPGPALTKEEVIARAKASRPFPPKTTRHSLPDGVPSRPTLLIDLLPSRPPKAPPVAHERSGRGAPGRSGS
jgi:hypothetical protein